MKTVQLFIVATLFFLAGAVLAQDAGKPNYSYLGTKKCRKCHFKQYKAWKKTKMANAFDLLKPGVRADRKKLAKLDPNKDYTTDAECLPCHTTGYGKKGGFVSMEKMPELAGVSCEMCHGAGSEYTKPEHMSNKNKNYKLAEVVKVGLGSPVVEETCISQCHNEKSPFYKLADPFDFKTRKEKGIHKHFPLKYKHD